MYYPALQDVSRSRSVQIEFRGLNHNDTVGETEFYQTENLSGLSYPVLTVREKRAHKNLPNKIDGMCAKEKLYYASNGAFYANGMRVDGIELTEGEKQIVPMGAYVVIFPDNILYNTASKKIESLDAVFETVDDVHYSLCTLSGTDYENYTVNPREPEAPKNGDFWMDTSDKPAVLKQYSASSAMWSSVPTVYTKISSNGIGAFFKKGDGITISGSQVKNCNGNFILMQADENYVVITAILEEAFTQSTSVTLERKVPQMDFVCEQNNRLWGCSSENHEIYASKLGDPKNWYAYGGLSTDSFAVTVGSPGDFTGCVSHLGYVLFFKEDIIHKIYGTSPSNYQLTDVHARGVEKGSSASLCTVNERLYYKSRDGVCVYDGSLPQNISEALGTGKQKNARGGQYKDLYYYCAEEDDGYSLYCFHTTRGLWFREDNTKAAFFTSLNGALYYYDEEKGALSVIGEKPADYTEEDTVAWSAETGDILWEDTAKRYLSRLYVRLEMEAGSTFKVFLSCDGEPFKEKGSFFAERKKVLQIPLIPRRCGSIRLKFSGEGYIKLLALTKIVEMGSEV